MFFGIARHAVDDKGRLAVPPRYRYQLEEGGPMISRGADHCLVIYPGEEWRRLVAGIRYAADAPTPHREFLRAVFPYSEPLQFDAQHRIRLTADQRAWTGIDRAVVLAGMNNVVEIFAAEVWDARQAAHDPGQLGELAARARAAQPSAPEPGPQVLA